MGESRALCRIKIYIYSHQLQQRKTISHFYTFVKMWNCTCRNVGSFSIILKSSFKSTHWRKQSIEVRSWERNYKCKFDWECYLYPSSININDCYVNKLIVFFFNRFGWFSVEFAVNSKKHSISVSCCFGLYLSASDMALWLLCSNWEIWLAV